MSNELESIVSAIPGPRSLELGRALASREARGVTYLAHDFPVFWKSARGATVTDVDGNRYLDLTSAFGVASVGHTNERVAAAIAHQAALLIHGMGDVHPTEVRTALLERLATLAPPALDRVFLCSTGAEAVEFALKTAVLATGKPGVLAFGGAYHGLSYGTLEVAGMEKFRAPFAAQLGGFARHVPYGDAAEARAALQRDSQIGCVLVEPIAGRSGTIVPPDDFLPQLRDACNAANALLIVDEIYTGFGRTGTWFACEHSGIVPDIMCLGKALGNGFPISATIGKQNVFDAWPTSTGEALHTSTYLGSPLGCAAALASLDELHERNLVARASELGKHIGPRLRSFAAGRSAVRGRGAMWAIDTDGGASASAIVTRALQRGVIVLQQGEQGQSIAIAPPLVITDAQLSRALDLLEVAFSPVTV